MALYRERIERAIESLLIRGFKVVQTLETPRSFGNTLIELSSEDLSVRVISDRAQIFVDVKRPRDEKWYSLDEILVVTGVKDAEGPWVDPQDAISELEKSEAVIFNVLNNPVLKSTLTARS